ncbi:MAG: c-type cytochrome [Bryobacteraceae bacterium]
MGSRRFYTWAAPLAAGLALAQTKLAKEPISSIPPSEGAQMYFYYCASCHGEEGKGDGPASKALKLPATDLTTLARNNNGEFPVLRVLTTLGRIQGGTRAHGNEDMPIWGDLFRASQHGEAIAQLRLYNLTQFLEAIQEPAEKAAKPAKKKAIAKPFVTSVDASSGGAMYRAYCSSCHGMAADGNGPMAPLMKVQPTDLTALARIYKGKFPTEYIAGVLGLRPARAAHGSADMPVWGDAFRQGGDDPARVQLRVYNLTKYLESVQR